MSELSTARGTIDTADLGVTLMHEHVFIMTTEIAENYPEIKIIAEQGICGPDFSEEAENVVATMLASHNNLTGVWAEKNTREAIYDAFRRKETFATSGTRLKVRFFGGWEYPNTTLKDAGWVQSAYRKGVPMGGDLPPLGDAGTVLEVARDVRREELLLARRPQPADQGLEVAVGHGRVDCGRDETGIDRTDVRGRCGASRDVAVGINGVDAKPVGGVWIEADDVRGQNRSRHGPDRETILENAVLGDADIVVRRAPREVEAPRARCRRRQETSGRP